MNNLVKFSIDISKDENKVMIRWLILASSRMSENLQKEDADNYIDKLHDVYKFLLNPELIVWLKAFISDDVDGKSKQRQEVLKLYNNENLMNEVVSKCKLKSNEEKELSVENLKKIASLEKSIMTEFFNDKSEDDEKQQTDESKNESEDKGKTNSYKEIMERWDDEISGAVNEVKAIYSKMFINVYGVPPLLGLLSQRGYIKFDNGSSTEKLVGAMEKIWNNVFSNVKSLRCALPNQELSSENIMEGINYYPYHLARYAAGIAGRETTKKEKNLKDLINKIEPKIKEVFFKIYASESTSIEEKEIQRKRALSALTTAILVTEYIPKKVLGLQIKIDGFAKDVHYWKQLISNGVLFSKTADCMASNYDHKTGILNVKIAIDSKLFALSPRFTYEIVNAYKESGRQMSMAQTILGKDLNDDVIEVDYTQTSGSSNMTFIVGTSGCGKGVMTLNTLAFAFASKSPVFYFDYKPDMAETLWRMGLDSGVPVFAYDGGSSIGISKGMFKPNTPFNSYAELVPDFMGEEDIRIKISQGMLYVKYLSTLIVLVNFTVDKEKREYLGIEDGIKCTVILDEMEAAYKAVIGAIKILLNLYNENDMSKPLKKGMEENRNPEIYEYTKKSLEFVADVKQKIDECITATLRLSSVNIIALYQHPDKQTWSDIAKEVDPNYRILNSIYDFAGLRIYGAGCNQVLGSQYGTGPLITKNPHVGDLLSKSQRYFMKFEGNSPGDKMGSHLKIFKPYMLLNTSKGDPFDNLPSEVKSLESVTDNEGNVNPLIGLDQLIPYMLGNKEETADALSKSYYIMEKLLNKCGIDKSVDEFMLSLNTDTMITIDKMTKLWYGESSESSESNPDDFMGGFTDESKDNNDFEDPLGEEFINQDLINQDPVNNEEPLKYGNIPIIPINQDYKETIYEYPKEDEYEDGEKDHEPDQDQDKDDLNEKSIEYSELNEEKTKDCPDNYDGQEPYYSKEESTTYDKKTGRMKTKKSGSVLSNENSFDCRGAGRVRLNMFENWLSQTPNGMHIYSNKLFESILDEAEYSGRLRQDMVTRIYLINGNMYINGKVLNLNGVLGGIDNTRLIDIVNFKKLFNRYKRLSELMVDTDIIRVMVMEYQLHNLDDIFNKLPRLTVFKVYDGINKPMEVKRGEYNKDSKTQKEVEKSRQEANYEVAYNTGVLKGLGKAWNKCTKGEKMWGISAAQRAFEYAGEGIITDGKMKPVKSLTSMTVGTVVGVVGGAAWLGFNLFKMPLQLMEMTKKRA